MKVGGIAACTAAALLALVLGSSSCRPSRPAPVNRATPVGSPAGPAVSAVVGPGGGSLAAPGGTLRVAIPAGVFSAPTPVTIQPITNLAHGGVGTAYRVEAQAGAAVSRATLVFSYSDQDVKGSAPGLLRVAFQRGDGQWQVMKGAVLDPKARTLTVQTDHLTDWSLVRGRVLKPSEATVKVGHAAYFEVLNCVESPGEPGDLAPLLYPCKPDTLPGDAAWEGATWEVNGRAGGDGVVGTVAEASGPRHGRYTAPAKVPNPDTVTVSARFKSDEDMPGGTSVVTAEVRIEEDQPPPDSGQIAVSVTAACEATYNFSDGTNTISDRVTVTLNERSVYRIVKYDNGENGTDLELVSYHSTISPKGGGTLQTPADVPEDIMPRSWKYLNREPTHPSAGLRLDLPGGRVSVGLWANFAELIHATPEQAAAGAGGVAKETIDDAEREDAAYRQALRASFQANAERVEVGGEATHSYTSAGGLGSGRLRVTYTVTGAVR